MPPDTLGVLLECKMNKPEAKAMLDDEIDRFRTIPYPELVGMVGGPAYVCERTGVSGETYQIEIEAFWDTSRKMRVRVAGSCDESPHKPVFWNIPVLRWIPIYVSSVTWTFSRDENGTDEKRSSDVMTGISEHEEQK